MSTADTPWPQKTRELHNHHMDSTIWNDFEFRDGDVVISTWAKSGTTWVQQLIGQLLHDGAPDVDVAAASPWLDLRVPPKHVKLEALARAPGRRFVKTHLPVDALVYSPRARYVFVARDGRDVVWSLYNHHARANDHWYALLNDTPGLVGPPMPRPPASIREYFNTWLARDGYPFWPFWDHVRGWWELRALPNLLLTHYADLKRDFPREARRIAEFLGLDADALRWDAILEHCSFDYMKRNAAAVAPLGGGLWDGGAGTFIHKGTNGRWRDTLSDEEVARYEATARERLGEDCARWLATGELP
ncbi:MAG: sulfotransferase domain-containing protein [Myxococcales bacterium]|nr:sulfotransferase domain-containing protein [Myxococcales bacterium]